MENHLPERKGIWGGNARDNQLFINAIFEFCGQEHLVEIFRPLLRLEEYPQEMLSMEIGKV